MEKSRTKNTIRNFTSGAIVQLINKLLVFVVRTVFIKVLSTEYLGINGLFTNILTVLSFAELGFGTTIIYNMYKPVLEEDKEKIKSLMHFYKKAYRVIGIVVAVCGIIVIPFIKYIITDVPDIKENIIVIYIFFLLNTVLSYFCTYKKSIITAYQQESIINKYATITYIIQAILNCVLLILTKNYILYLLIQIMCTFIGNIAISAKADKMFPYLKDKNIKSIPKEDKKSIYTNVKSMVAYKFGQTILNGTDNIILSAMFGVVVVGVCSNYTLIITSVVTVIVTALNSITGNIGNLNASYDRAKKEKVFYELFFISFVIYNFCMIAIMILINPFIQLWLGEQYLISYSIVIALSVSSFVDGIRFASYTYRTTLGLFEKGRYAPLASAVINIILSIVLGNVIGIAGIFVATAIARLLTTTWIDPYLIHKYEFKTPLRKFFKKYLKYCIVFVLGYLICYSITIQLKTIGILDLIVKAIIVVIVPNVLTIAVFHKTEEYIGIVERIKTILKV